MHIPDGFLSLPVSAAAGIVSAAGLGLSLKKLKSNLSEKTIPLMGVMAAFIFAAQMFNFPVAGGTSGHLLGGALSAIVLGPFAGTVALSVVLIIQCLLFQDGGLIALGANILNMAIIGVWCPWAAYVSLKKVFSERGFSVAVFLSAWLSVVLASTACAVELGLSGIVPIATALPIMVSVHAVIGIGEGIITVLVVGFLKKAKPELI